MTTDRLALSLLLAANLGAAENMLGRQSQNEGLQVLPAPAAGVKIDGDLGEWDWNSRIWIFADTSVRSRYAAEVAAMWDNEALYLAVKWKDPTPMFSVVDPDHNPGDGWKSDALQLRLRTSDQVSWVTAWYFTARKMPVLTLVKWKDPDNDRGGSEQTIFKAQPGGSDLGEGVQMAYKADADGKGYAQELRLPWRHLHRTAPTMQVGSAFRLGLEFLWGDPTGGLAAPIHRYADNMQPGATSREFFWSNWKAWGEATLAAAGPLASRRYVAEGGLIAGTVPVRAALPAGANRFTLVIEDAAGTRIRNLAGDCEPADYAVPGGVEVKWDCLDDLGRPVAPGTYAVRGLSHSGLSAEYEQCYYNPGTPPWSTKDGRGAWGSDHYPPSGVASAGGITVVSWEFAEGGYALIGIGADGRKIWSQYRGADLVASDGEFVYAFQSAGWGTMGSKADFLCRYALKDGTPRPFTVGGTLRSLDLTLHEVLGLPGTVQATGLAVGQGRLALAMASGEIVVLDAGDLRLLARVKADRPAGLAFAADGALYALTGDASRAEAKAVAASGLGSGDYRALAAGRPCRVDLAAGTLTPLELPGLGQASALAVDRAGNLLVADTGPDQQVKAFAADGRLVYTCGRRGGRGLRGAFAAPAMTRMSALAVDANDRIWVTEYQDYPRRVSVWGRDGALVRDYLGSTGYSGVGCYLHDQRPDLAYCGPLEFAIGADRRSAVLSRILWVPDAAKGERFPISTGSNAMPVRFTSAISGQPREYLYWRGEGGPHVILMEQAGAWKPVAAVCLVGQLLELMDYHLIPKAAAAGEWAGLDAGDGVFWNDADGDGIPRRAECVIVPVPAKTPVGTRLAAPALALDSGWAGRLGEDFAFYTTDQAGALIRYRPLRFTAAGAPVYGPEGMAKLGVSGVAKMDTVPVPGEDLLICLGANHGGAEKPFLGVDLKTGAVRWSYPNHYAGVHGSHLATMPKPGLLIGPLRICGLARLEGDLGTVLLIRGNLGQDFLFTSDGLCVGTMFTDTRFPREMLPEDEKQLIGRPLDGFSEGSEPFNGWFGRQADGRVRQVNGMPGQAAMIQEIKGLETIRRLRAEPVSVDAATIATAVAAATARNASATEAKVATVARFANPPLCDGSGAGWDGVVTATVQVRREGQPDSAVVKLGHDGVNLLVRWEVRDASPWKNAGSDYSRLFKTGDCVDLHLRADPAASGDQPRAGDQRVVIANLGGKPAAVLMRPVDAAAPAGLRKSYTSPVQPRNFDRVEVLAGVRLGLSLLPGGYRVEAVIPFAALGVTLKPGLVLRGDVGFISSDAQGLLNTARTYWANPDTNLVSDLPSEAWLYPGKWGEFRLE